jgi:hypothetical protein
MQDAASVLTDQFAELLGRLPAGLDLNRLALETKANYAFPSCAAAATSRPSWSPGAPPRRR